MKAALIIFSLICFAILPSGAQVPTYGPNDTITVAAEYYQGEWVPSSYLEQVTVETRLLKAQSAKAKEYIRLRNAVYVTYPYARRAGAVMNDINANLMGITDKAKRKEYIRSREKELRNDFEKPITDLSVYQGKVLMKLINRETGNNCFDIIKDYKGGVTARFYQTVAYFFDSNLKQAYDPSSGTDATIESYVHEVQQVYGLTEIRKAVGIN